MPDVWDEALDDWWWAKHVGWTPEQVEQIPVMRARRLRAVWMRQMTVQQRHSPAQQQEDAARLADAKRKAGQA